MIARTLIATALFSFALAAFVVFVKFASRALRGKDSDVRLFGAFIAVTAFGAVLFFARWGFAAIGV